MTSSQRQSVTTTTTHIVILPSEIRDRHWSNARHVTWINSVDRSTLRQERHAMHLRLIFGPNTILGRSNIYSASRSLHNFGAEFFSGDLGSSQYLYNDERDCMTTTVNVVMSD